MANKVYHFYPAKGKVTGLVSIPHSGEIIPAPFEEFLIADSRALNEDVDYKVPELIDIGELNGIGLAVIVAKIHRVCVDLNRGPEVSVLNWRRNSKGVPLVVKEPGREQILRLQEEYYAPYYNTLKRLMDYFSANHQTVPVIDLHSMPSTPTEYHLKMNPDQNKERPDFCVSDLKGKTCERNYIEYIISSLIEMGYDARINDPYFGGFITKYLCNYPVNNVQIETKRSLYMNELTRELIPQKALKVKSCLTELIVNTVAKFSN